MKKQDLRRSMFAFSATLGLALVGALGASAQGSVEGMLPNGQREYTEEELNAYPLEIGYPMAAPGSLNVYHYMNINGRDTIHHGSASDMRMKQKKQMDAERMMLMKSAMNSGAMMPSVEGSLPNGQREYTEDEMNSYPLSLGYPMSSPGGLNVYHYMNINGRDTIHHGSASDMRQKQQAQRDAERMMMMKNAMNNGAMTPSVEGSLPNGQREYTEEELNAYPLELGYPMASPGSVNVYHYMNINGKDVIMHGSASEMRQKQQAQRDAERMMLMKNAMSGGMR